MEATKKYFGPCQTALDYFSRGNFKKLINDFEGALKDFNRAIELRPTFWEAYYQRGNLFSTMNKIEEANLDFNKSIELILKYF